MIKYNTVVCCCDNILVNVATRNSAMNNIEYNKNITKIEYCKENDELYRLI
jgi:hypothetical protein